MKRHRRLVWASVSHLMIDFICAWMIINRIPGSEAWFIKMLTYNFRRESFLTVLPPKDIEQQEGQPQQDVCCVLSPLQREWIPMR